MVELGRLLAGVLQAELPRRDASNVHFPALSSCLLTISARGDDCIVN